VLAGPRRPGGTRRTTDPARLRACRLDEAREADPPSWRMEKDILKKKRRRSSRRRVGGGFAFHQGTNRDQWPVALQLPAGAGGQHAPDSLRLARPPGVAAGRPALGAELTEGDPASCNGRVPPGVRQPGGSTRRAGPRARRAGLAVRETPWARAIARRRAIAARRRRRFRCPRDGPTPRMPTRRGFAPQPAGTATLSPGGSPRTRKWVSATITYVATADERGLAVRRGAG